MTPSGTTTHVPYSGIQANKSRLQPGTRKCCRKAIRWLHAMASSAGANLMPGLRWTGLCRRSSRSGGDEVAVAPEARGGVNAGTARWRPEISCQAAVHEHCVSSSRSGQLCSLPATMLELQPKFPYHLSGLLGMLGLSTTRSLTQSARDALPARPYPTKGQHCIAAARILRHTVALSTPS